MDPHQTKLDFSIDYGGWIRSNMKDISAIAYNQDSDYQTLIASGKVWTVNWGKVSDERPLPVYDVSAQTDKAAYGAGVSSVALDFTTVTPAQVLALGIPIRELTEWDPSTPLLPENEIDPNSPMGSAGSKLHSIFNNAIPAAGAK